MNENNMGIIFRSSFAGYNKEDVNNYIFNENRRFSSIEHSYLVTIDELRGELARANEEIERLREISVAYEALKESFASVEISAAEKIEKMEKDHERVVAALSDSSSTIESLSAEIENSATETDSLKRALSVCKDELEGVKNELSTTKEELSLKSSELSMAEISVNNYRVRLDEEILLKNELNAKLEAAASEVESAKESVKSAMDDLNAVRAEFTAVKRELAVARDDAANAKEELLLLQNGEDVSKTRVDILQDIADSLKEALADTKAVDNTQINSKIEQAEMMSQKLLDRAKDASEEMLRRAEKGTLIILDKAREEAVSYRTDMLNVTKDIISTVTDELLRSVDRCMIDFISGIRSTGNYSETASSEISRCGDEFSRRIEKLQSDLDRTIAAKLAEFDVRHGWNK